MTAASDGDLLILSDAQCQEVVDEGDAFRAVEGVFAAMAAGSAVNFPVIREAIGHAGALYGFKSGFDRAGMALGVKSGGYWPENMVAHGIPNHQSSIFLFDPDTGRLQAIVGGNYLTAVRTAAASAVSIYHLARKDAAVLGIVGAGHQSRFQLRAALKQRRFTEVLGWNRSPAGLSVLADVAAEFDLPFTAVSPQELAAAADVIITITSSHDALLMAGWVRPGTHISAMGTDTKGKRELDENICAGSVVFTDEIQQSISIGEAQHAIAAGVIEAGDITPIGAVINGDHAGRPDDAAVTVFDGTGVGLQDLALASVAVHAALSAGVGQRVRL